MYIRDRLANAVAIFNAKFVFFEFSEERCSLAIFNTSFLRSLKKGKQNFGVLRGRMHNFGVESGQKNGVYLEEVTG